LDRTTLDCIKDLHVVLGGDSEALLVCFSFVEHFTNTFLVIHDEDSILHKFDRAAVVEISRSTLSSIIHNGHLKVGAFGKVSHRDSEWDWIVVSADIVKGERLVLEKIHLMLEFAEVSLLHFETI
jgi:hypothetical protein